MKTNDRPLGNVMSDASGDFQMQVVLDRGENHLSVQTSNPCGTSSAATIDLSVAAEPEPEPSPPSAPGNPTPLPDAHSSPDSIIPGSTSGQETPGKGTAPSSSKNDTPSTGLTLEITSPKDNSSTSEDSIFISGVTSKETTETIAVNGKETARLATPSSTFGVLVPLHMGKNLIKVVATAGDQSAVAWLHVTRVKPSQQPLPWYEQYQWLLIPPAAALTAFLTVVLLRQRRRQ